MGFREPAVVRELERCFAVRVAQFLELARQFPGAIDGSPIGWAKAEVIEVLEPLPEYPGLQPLIVRVFDEEILRRSASAPAPASASRTPSATLALRLKLVRSPPPSADRFQVSAVLRVVITLMS
jgi:hypothetical protein